jgi:hypothetical protein
LLRVGVLRGFDDGGCVGALAGEVDCEINEELAGCLPGRLQRANMQVMLLSLAVICLLT